MSKTKTAPRSKSLTSSLYQLNHSLNTGHTPLSKSPTKILHLIFLIYPSHLSPLQQKLSHLLRLVIINRPDLMLLLALSRHNPPHMPPLAIDHREAPDLRGVPAVLGGLGVRDDDVALFVAFAFLEPVLLEKVVFESGDFGESETDTDQPQ